MKLTLSGHDDRYAVEQLQLSLFPEQAGGEAVPALHRGQTWLTAARMPTVSWPTTVIIALIFVSFLSFELSLYQRHFSAKCP